MWEFKRVEYSIHIDTIVDMMKKINKMGGDGWDIVYYNEEKCKNFDSTVKIVVLYKKLKS